MTFTTPWFTFNLSVMMLSAVVGLVLFFVARVKRARDEKKQEKVDHGEIKPVALSKIKKMKPGSVVATLQLKGPLLASSGGMPAVPQVTYADLFVPRLSELADDDAVAAIIIDGDTPGGSPVASERMREGIIRAQAKKPVFFFVSNMIASGGMWVASAAKDVTAAPATVLGSVGVVSATLFEYDGITKMTGFLGKGVEATSIKGKLMSSGSGKGFGHPFAEKDEAAEKRFQAWLDDTRADFVDLVASRPGVNRALLEEQGASVYGPKKALEIGVIDRILSRFEFDEYVAKTIGKKVDDLTFVVVERVKKGSMASLFASTAATFGITVVHADPLEQLSHEPMLAMLPSYIEKY